MDLMSKILSHIDPHTGSVLEINVIHVFVIFGATGNLSNNKIMPALWELYRKSLLPNCTHIFGYSRTKITKNEFMTGVRRHLKINDMTEYNSFSNICSYIHGEYVPKDIEAFNKEITLVHHRKKCNRIFYLALPPSVFQVTATLIYHYLADHDGWNRMIVEKPFGRDTESAEKLSKHLTNLFKEDELYRIDHYLGKEMVQNILTIRFANKIFETSWNRESIASVLISLKETKSVEQRGAYFDDYGIIRDVMQNHLLQILSLVAMEKPVSLQPEDIRDEKVRVLRNIRPLKRSDVVIGQYVGNPDATLESHKYSYLEDPTVKPGSMTPTFAIAALKIHNDRWDGVPFILKCGKCLNDQKAEVRIQFKDIKADVFNGFPKRNELVIRVQPGEAVYIKMMTNSPGLSFKMIETDLDLTYLNKFDGMFVTEAYVKLILDVFCGAHMHFVRTDELREAWRIFTPVLHDIDRREEKPILYLAGTRGPVEADRLCAENDFIYRAMDSWSKDQEQLKSFSPSLRQQMSCQTQVDEEVDGKVVSICYRAGDVIPRTLFEDNRLKNCRKCSKYLDK